MLNMSVVCERSTSRMVVGWVTAFAVAIVATLGATSVTSAQDIWRTTQGLVKIVDAEKTSSNQHPISFSEGDVYFALRAIKVQKSGRMFYRGNRLNFIFGSALNDARRATGAIDANANRFGIRQTQKTLHGKRGTRKSRSRISAEVLPSDSVKLARLNGKVRNDWVVVGLDSAVRAGAGQIRGAQQQAVTNAPASAASAPAASNRSAEEQLARLKSLRDKGLVTEQAYQAQILKILDRSL